MNLTLYILITHTCIRYTRIDICNTCVILNFTDEEIGGVKDSSRAKSNNERKIVKHCLNATLEIAAKGHATDIVCTIEKVEKRLVRM